MKTQLAITALGFCGANVMLSWPSPSTGLVLQQKDSFNPPPPARADSLMLATDNGFIKSVTVPHNLASRFYRLSRP